MQIVGPKSWRSQGDTAGIRAFVGLRFNDTTVYTWTWLNLKDGPLVVEVRPMVLGGINDIWFHWVTDAGFTGLG